MCSYVFLDGGEVAFNSFQRPQHHEKAEAAAKGAGVRKALRALAIEPSRFAMYCNTVKNIIFGKTYSFYFILIWLINQRIRWLA